MLTTASLEQARAQFPALQDGFVYLENAGGSQVPRSVIEGTSAFLREQYVQLGAGYPAAVAAGETVDKAHAFVERLLGAPAKSVVLGPSTTQLVQMLAGCFSHVLQPGDKVVVSVANHEANAGPWARLERFGIEVVLWGVDAQTGESRLEDLQALLDDKVKLVALAHTSNLLGDIVDIEAVCRMAHAVGAQVVADGVAQVPHRAVDVEALGVDFYVFSAYKLFGPHIAAMYGKPEAWAALPSPNHFFFPHNDFPHRFECGCLNYEGCAGLLGTEEYLNSLGEQPFTTVVEWEAPLQQALIDWIKGREGFRLFGSQSSGPERVPTISFVHESIPSSRFTLAAREAGIGIRNGHMYAYRLCKALGVPTDEGVVRTSAVHYNTPEEVVRLLDAWGAII